MAKEFEKYKRILEREDKEFKEAMKAEVSTSLLSNLSKMKDTTLEKHVLLPILHQNLFNFLLIDIPFHSYNNNIILFQGLDPGLSRYEVALALYERAVGSHPEKVCHVPFSLTTHMVSRKNDKSIANTE